MYILEVRNIKDDTIPVQRGELDDAEISSIGMEMVIEYTLHDFYGKYLKSYSPLAYELMKKTQVKVLNQEWNLIYRR